MADNTTLNSGSGGDAIRDIDRGAAKTQVIQLDHGGASGESLTSTSNPLPVANYDSSGTSQSNFPAGFQRTTDEPRQLFYDPFDTTTLDVTNRWNAPIASGGGVVSLSAVSGAVTLGTGTTANGFSHLSSQASFTPTIPAWLGYSFAIALADGASPTANTYRFWGVGTVPTTPTSLAPLTDACGFEIDTSGKMYAVVYAGGSRSVIQDLSAATGNSKQPTDANYHRYIVYYRTDKIYFYIDGLAGANLVATANFTGPTVQTLPVRFLAVAGAVAPLSSGVISCTGLAVWDTGKNNSTISDGTFGWRKATVKPSSTASVATDTALVVAPHPNSAVRVGDAYGNVVSAQGNAFAVQDATNGELLLQILIELRVLTRQITELPALLNGAVSPRQPDEPEAYRKEFSLLNTSQSATVN